MGKLIESTFVTFDGVISDPGVWGSPYWDDEHSGYAGKLVEDADALLLGRETYEALHKAWPQRGADLKINQMPKYVASRTLTETTWNASLLEGEVPGGREHAQGGPNLLKYGTGSFSRTLLEHQLVDEYHFWVFPVALGSGERLFDGIDTTHLKLLDTSPFASGIVVHVYGPEVRGATAPTMDGRLGSGAMIDPARVARELYGLDAVATAAARRARPQLPARGGRRALRPEAARSRAPDLALEDAVLEHLRDEPAVPRLAGPSRRRERPHRAAAELARGRPWADGGGDLAELGRTVARVDRALRDFEHPQMHRPHRWDIEGASSPALDHLPHQVIHNDANEHNVLVGAGRLRAA